MEMLLKLLLTIFVANGSDATYADFDWTEAYGINPYGGGDVYEESLVYGIPSYKDVVVKTDDGSMLSDDGISTASGSGDTDVESMHERRTMPGDNQEYTMDDFLEFHGNNGEEAWKAWTNSWISTYPQARSSSPRFDPTGERYVHSLMDGLFADFVDHADLVGPDSLRCDDVKLQFQEFLERAVKNSITANGIWDDRITESDSISGDFRVKQLVKQALIDRHNARTLFIKNQLLHAANYAR